LYVEVVSGTPDKVKYTFPVKFKETLKPKLGFKLQNLGVAHT